MNWYLSYDGQQLGPMDENQAKNYVRHNAEGLAWREGFKEWVPIAAVPELNPTSPPPLNPGSCCPAGLADQIEYKVVGAEMQFVEIELDPGKSIVAEAGSLMYKDSSIEMDTIFGDGSAKSGGLFDKLLSAGKRALTGAGLFVTVFTNRGLGKTKAAFAAPYPGNIIPVHLPAVGGKLICQKDSFLCAAKGVAIEIFFQRKIMTGLFGGDGFIMQQLEGDGMIFMHAGGTIVERQLQPGEVIQVNTGCVVAFEPTVQFEIEQVGNIKTAMFGGEGLFFAVLRGPGKIWLQSLPFSRLAGRMLAAAPPRGGTGDEGNSLGRTMLGGAILGGLGGLLGGDDRDDNI